MTTHRRTSSVRLATSLIACAGLAFAALAQPPVPNAPRPRPAAAPVAASQEAMPSPALPAAARSSGALPTPGGQSAQPEPVLDLEFGGGTVGEYVELVRRGSPEVLNFAMADGISDLAIVPLTLRAVSPRDAVEMVARLAKPIADTRLIVEERVGPGSRTFIVEAVPDMTPSGGPRRKDPELVTRVFSINSLVGPAWSSDRNDDESRGLTAPVVLASLEQGLSIADPWKPDPMIRFHTDSGLLIVRGTQSQIEVAELTIRNLQSDRRQLADRNEHREQRVIKLARAKPAEVVDAIRAVFPIGMANGPEVASGENAISISGPRNIVAGIEALAAYLDSARTPSESEIRGEMERMSLRHRLEQTQQEQTNTRNELIGVTEKMRAMAIEQERALLQADEGKRQLVRALQLEEQLQVRSAEIADLRSELERARQAIAELQRASAQRPGTNPPQETPR